MTYSEDLARYKFINEEGELEEGDETDSQIDDEDLDLMKEGHVQREFIIGEISKGQSFGHLQVLEERSARY